MLTCKRRLILQNLTGATLNNSKKGIVMGNDSEEKAKILDEICYQIEDAVIGANYVKRNLLNLLINYGEDKELRDDEPDSVFGSEEINEDNITDNIFRLKDDIDETISLLRKIKKLPISNKEDE